jgi:hypothetical protein
MNKINYDDSIRVGDLVICLYVKDKILRVTDIEGSKPASWDPNRILNPQVTFIEVLDFSSTRILRPKKRKSKIKTGKGWDISHFIKLDQNGIDTLKAKLDEITSLLP